MAAVHYRALIEAEVDEAGLLNVLQPMSDGDIRDYVARAVDVFMRAYDQRRNELSSQFLADGGVSSLERVLKAAIKSLIERRRAWCKYLVAHLDAIKSGA